MRYPLLSLIILCSSLMLRAQDSTTVTVSAMADVAYSYSFNTPPDHTRAYTTQPSRDREFGLMLGHIAVAVTNNDFRARVAVQEGWFTRANYVGDDADWRNLQEASVGLRITDGLWLDGGVMFSHIGYESLISRDNLTLGRSLTADYTPYYSTGVALAWSLTDDLTITGLVLNGWQQIVDVNTDLSIGTRVFWKASPKISVNWSTYYGNDQPDGMASLMRFHNNFYVEFKPTDALTAVVLGDLCLQDTPDGNTNQQWYAGVIGAWAFADNFRLAARAERYVDPDQIFIVPINGASFETTGLSVNLDFRPTAYSLLRCEVRSLMAGDEVFPTDTGFSTSDTYATFSTSIAF